MNPNDAERLVDMLIDAYRIAGYIDEKENPLLFSDIDQLCLDLRSHVVSELTKVGYFPLTTTRESWPSWTVTSADLLNGGAS